MYKILFALLLCSQPLFAQNIAAFTDYQKNFWIFDEGKFRQWEFQPILSSQTGDKCIAYETNGNHFKIYYNHIDYDISAMIRSYQVTDNLVTYTVGSQLYVFENGIKKNLSRFVSNYITGDSIVAFYDSEKYYLQVYYGGKIITVADGIVSGESSQFLAGCNLMAFKDAYHNFLVFYQNQIYNLIRTELDINAKLGRNILAFIDPNTDYLRAFYKGDVIDIESFNPKSFQVGYEKIAYVDNTENFKIFDNGEIYTICSFIPDSYTLKDNMLVYHQQGQLWAYINGESVMIENYIPSSYEISDNLIVYLDQNGYLKVFENGKSQVLSYEKINQYAVLRKIVIFNEGMNTTKIYYQGETYSN